MQKPDFGYPEINALNTLWVKHKVITKTDRTKLLGGKTYYPKVDFTISGQSFWLFVDDEYEDLRYNYPLLNFCLILRELEGYAYAPEFEIWCQERFLSPDDKSIAAAFEHLKKTYAEVESILGKLESHVSDWDFEMNAGAAQKLRRSK